MYFSPQRFWAIIRKEFILMKRDPSVILIMAILPIILVSVAGYIIDTYPKNVPTVLVSYDNSPITRDLITRIKNTGYFSFIKTTNNSDEAYHLLKNGSALFVLTIPDNFTPNFIRKQSPSLILEDGGIDALSTGRAVATLSGLKQYYLLTIKPGPLFHLKISPPAFKIVYHRLFNPENITQYYTIPGVITLVLMLTMLMITSIVAFRDIQGGTIDYLLLSPTKPSEILLGEIFSYILIGYIQLIIGIGLSIYLFDVPFVGSIYLLLLCSLPYIIAELSLGLTIATFCDSQFEAMQVINLFIAFSILLTGFIFPVFTMPEWAQYISLLLPMTHFLKIIYGIILKGNDISDLWPHLWPLCIFSIVTISIAVNRFKRQLHLTG